MSSALARQLARDYFQTKLKGPDLILFRVVFGDLAGQDLSGGEVHALIMESGSAAKAASSPEIPDNSAPKKSRWKPQDLPFSTKDRALELWRRYRAKHPDMPAGRIIQTYNNYRWPEEPEGKYPGPERVRALLAEAGVEVPRPKGGRFALTRAERWTDEYTLERLRQAMESEPFVNAVRRIVQNSRRKSKDVLALASAAGLPPETPDPAPDSQSPSVSREDDVRRRWERYMAEGVSQRVAFGRLQALRHFEPRLTRAEIREVVGLAVEPMPRPVSPTASERREKKIAKRVGRLVPAQVYDSAEAGVKVEDRPAAPVPVAVVRDALEAIPMPPEIASLRVAGFPQDQMYNVCTRVAAGFVSSDLARSFGIYEGTAVALFHAALQVVNWWNEDPAARVRSAKMRGTRWD